MTYTIYLRRNKVNGKSYVGQTNNFKRREYNWRCLKQSYTNKYIDEDRAKYGLDNFTVEVLATADNREDAWEIEQRFINDYKTLWPNGYNIAKGGGGPNGVCPSDETRQKLSENNAKYWLGKHFSNEARQKMSEANKGKHLSDKTRRKMSEVRKGKLLNRKDLSKPVYQYTLDGELVKIWPSASEAARELKFNKGHICSCCRGKLKQYKKYLWKYE